MLSYQHFDDVKNIFNEAREGNDFFSKKRSWLVYQNLWDHGARWASIGMFNRVLSMERATSPLFVTGGMRPNFLILFPAHSVRQKGKGE
jgi:hypothetical protein